MGPIVGLTLIVLGIYVLADIARNGSNARLRSRWMLVGQGVYAGFRKVRNLGNRRVIEVDHTHDHSAVDDSHDHDHDRSRQAGDDGSDLDPDLDPTVAALVGSSATVVSNAPAAPTAATPGSPSGFGEPLPEQRRRHAHSHSHSLTLADNPLAGYGNASATGIGVLHGIGVESPTQIVIFTAAVATASATEGVILLAAWILGLVIANAGIAILAGFGVMTRNSTLRVIVTAIAGVVSLALGTLMVLGMDSLIPAL